MDSIMQWTAGLATAVATLAFAITFLAGIWLAARFGKFTLIPALLVGAAAFYLRRSLPAVSIEAIGLKCVLHIAAGCLLGLWLRGRKRYGPVDR